MSNEIIDKPKFNFKNTFYKNKFKIISFISLIILTIITFIIIAEYKERKNIEISENYNRAKILIDNNNSETGLKILEEIIFKKNIFYSPSALNLIIDKNLISDNKKILSYYDQIISIDNLDPEIKYLFIFKKIIFVGDDINENELISALKPILKSDSLWKNTASDYIKKYYLSKGELKKAKQFDNSLN